MPDSSSTCGRFNHIATCAGEALREELAAYPKPGLVSFRDSGSHGDMDAGVFLASVSSLHPHFESAALAGSRQVSMNELRRQGRKAEQDMLAATRGVNTHRGAIFSLGLICAAAGARSAEPNTTKRNALGRIVAQRWGADILDRNAFEGNSHGQSVFRRYGALGARGEAANGFPHVYGVGLPAFRGALKRHPREKAVIQCLFALLARVPDTTLLHRGGMDGLAFCRKAARWFLERGGVNRPDWFEKAEILHREFVRRRLSIGGVADLLAATLLLQRLEEVT